jgi:hypothetical protein
MIGEVALSALMLAFATDAHEPRSLDQIAFIVTGTEASLIRFEHAAHACGARLYSENGKHGRHFIGVRRDLSAAFDDPRIECAIRWVMDHPKGLYFVGNAAYR